jgi:hypothetical protein
MPWPWLLTDETAQKHQQSINIIIYTDPVAPGIGQAPPGHPWSPSRGNTLPDSRPLQITK